MVLVREIDISEMRYWNKEVQKLDFAHPFNAYGWGTVRKINGWLPRYFVAERENDFCGGMLILQKRLLLTPFSVFTIPRGPLWKIDSDETLIKFFEIAKNLAKREKGIFLRIDPGIKEKRANEITRKLDKLGFKHLKQRWTAWNAPRDVLRIDLKKYKDLDHYFSSLKSKTRNYIRKPGKRGVTIESANNEYDLRKFYNLFKQFSVEKGFLARGYDYQKEVWNSYVKKGLGQLILGKYNGEIIGGAMCIAFGRGCRILHLGENRDYKKFNTQYLYVFETVKWAIENGCEWYSFGGVSSKSQEFFKKKFLPENFFFVGYYDLKFNSFLYYILYFFEFIVLPRAFPVLARIRQMMS